MPTLKRGLAASTYGSGGREFKADGATGQVRAVFATLNIVDLDQDVTLPGAFSEGAPVVISAYGHKSWDGALPVGRGTIGTVGDSAVLDGQFFMGVPAARDTFEVVRELGPLGEWSYGYDATDTSFGDWQGKQVRFLKALDVHEVSPTLKGSGIQTMTLDAKSRAEIEAIRAALFGDQAEAAAREYARFTRHLIGAHR